MTNEITLRLDLHVHSERSFDSRMSRRDIAEAAKAAGLDGVAVCDHNVNPEYNEIRRENGILFIPGIELYTECGHLLGLFVERQIETPKDIMGKLTLEEAVRRIHLAGGIAVMAHPYQKIGAEEHADKIASLCDGIEIFNSRAVSKRFDANKLASDMAKSKNIKCKTAGSDSHMKGELGGAVCVVRCMSESAEDIKQALISGSSDCSGKACRRTNIAKSQFIRYRKAYRDGMPPKIKLKWAKLAAACVARDIKYAVCGLFNRENI